MEEATLSMDNYEICGFYWFKRYCIHVCYVCSNWELTAAWTGAQVKVPVKFITGDLDVVYTSLGTKDYIDSGAFKRDVPYLEEVVVQEGVAHFNNQEAAEDVSNHIYEFIKKF